MATSKEVRTNKKDGENVFDITFLLVLYWVRSWVAETSVGPLRRHRIRPQRMICHTYFLGVFSAFRAMCLCVLSCVSRQLKVLYIPVFGDEDKLLTRNEIPIIAFVTGFYLFFYFSDLLSRSRESVSRVSRIIDRRGPLPHQPAQLYTYFR